jgi:hypothetical protein
MASCQIFKGRNVTKQSLGTFKHISALETIFKECERHAQVGSARVEVRMPFRLVSNYLVMGLPTDVLRASILRMDCRLLW